MWTIFILEHELHLQTYFILSGKDLDVCGDFRGFVNAAFVTRTPFAMVRGVEDGGPRGVDVDALALFAEK